MGQDIDGTKTHFGNSRKTHSGPQLLVPILDFIERFYFFCNFREIISNNTTTNNNSNTITILHISPYVILLLLSFITFLYFLLYILGELKFLRELKVRINLNFKFSCQFLSGLSQVKVVQVQ